MVLLQHYLMEQTELFKKIHVFRIKPDSELFSEVKNYCQLNKINSGVILGIVGSLKSATLSYLAELPARYKEVNYEGPLELVCAQGSLTLLEDLPVLHIHIQISQENGCYGGHLVSATVFSTAEVVIGELDYQLSRQYSNYTGLNELTR